MPMGATKTSPVRVQAIAEVILVSTALQAVVAILTVTLIRGCFIECEKSYDFTIVSFPKVEWNILTAEYSVLIPASSSYIIVYIQAKYSSQIFKLARVLSTRFSRAISTKNGYKSCIRPCNK